ncbi:MAG: hypothetical protein WDN31_12895 [Hyphomicrobium sp.]
MIEDGASQPIVLDKDQCMFERVGRRQRSSRSFELLPRPMASPSTL